MGDFEDDEFDSDRLECPYQHTGEKLICGMDKKIKELEARIAELEAKILDLSKDHISSDELKHIRELAQMAEGANLVIGRIEEMFPDWKNYLELEDCIRTKIKDCKNIEAERNAWMERGRKAEARVRELKQELENVCSRFWVLL